MIHGPTDRDRLFKELLTTFFFDFLQHLTPAEAAEIDPSSIEFPDELARRR
jgi:hypothetical protein